jgi:uncharacterized protein
MPDPSAVLDTNVIISAHLNPDGYERFALDLGLARKFQIYVSPAIFEEYRGVLGREKFGIDPQLVCASLELMAKAAIMVNPTRRVRAAKHPEDNKFLECTRESAADYLVTGNKRHFPRRFGAARVVNAREFLENIIPQLSR